MAGAGAGLFKRAGRPVVRESPRNRYLFGVRTNRLPWLIASVKLLFRQGVPWRRKACRCVMVLQPEQVHSLRAGELSP